jgi:hypothetical protein
VCVCVCVSLCVALTPALTCGFSTSTCTMSLCPTNNFPTASQCDAALDTFRDMCLDCARGTLPLALQNVFVSDCLVRGLQLVFGVAGRKYLASECPRVMAIVRAAIDAIIFMLPQHSVMVSTALCECFHPLQPFYKEHSALVPACAPRQVIGWEDGWDQNIDNSLCVSHSPLYHAYL